MRLVEKAGLLGPPFHFNLQAVSGLLDSAPDRCKRTCNNCPRYENE
jgi:hypothetical protein